MVRRVGSLALTLMAALVTATATVTTPGCHDDDAPTGAHDRAGAAGKPGLAHADKPSASPNQRDAQADDHGDKPRGAGDEMDAGDVAVDAPHASDAASPMDAGHSMDASQSSLVRDAQTGSSVPCQAFNMPNDCSVPAGAVLPSELRCTGLYSDLAAKRIACGVELYKPAFELWSDGAEKQRYIALPPGSQIDVSDPDNFVFPVGTQLWKEFRVDDHGTRRLAETRLLRKSAEGWLYTSYVWSSDGSRAVQQNAGVDDLFGSGHTVPTRDQCRSCHEGRPDFVLGWDLLMLGEGASGLTRLELARRGLLRRQLSDGSSEVLAEHSPLLQSRIPGTPVEHDALGYLHANCGVSCHNATTAAGARDTGLVLRIEHKSLTNAFEAPAVATGVNRTPSPQAKLPPGGPYFDVRPGDTEHSLVLARMNVRGTEAQMPRLGTNRVDTRGVGLISRWIIEMTEQAGYPPAAALEGGLEPTPDVPDAGRPMPREDAGTPSQPVDSGAAADCQSGEPDTTGLAYQVVVRDSRLSVATFAAQAPDSDDWYIVDMVGAIWRLRAGAAALEEQPFLDLRSAVQLGAGFDQTTLTYDERGLVGLAFAPDYASSRLFYVTLTPSRDNALGLAVDHDMVLEFYAPADGSQPMLARKLLELPSASALLGNIHNLNTVRFGPDGLLYVGSGDGGGVNCNDAERGAAQDISRVFGKILRLDPHAPAPYGALGNPFALDGDPRVFHYGLRNPFRFSFDRQTGDLLIGDVGQDTYEEFNFAPSGSSGLNFGWPTFEANASCPGTTTPLSGPAGHTPPSFVANRSAFATGPFSDFRAITGGIVYRGTTLASLRGHYLFGDYYGDRLGVWNRCAANESTVSTLAKACDPNNPDEGCLPTPAGAARFDTLTAIIEDHAGEIYFVANGNSVLKLVKRP